MSARAVRPGQGCVRDETRDDRLGSKGRVVRWTEEGFELQCLVCREFWPLTAEFWRYRAIARCRGCYRETHRRAQAQRRTDPAVMAEHVARYRAERRARRGAA